MFQNDFFLPNFLFQKYLLLMEPLFRKHLKLESIISIFLKNVGVHEEKCRGAERNTLTKTVRLTLWAFFFCFLGVFSHTLFTQFLPAPPHFFFLHPHKVAQRQKCLYINCTFFLFWIMKSGKFSDWCFW